MASLNSGSNGNCYYIGNGADSVLIDAGISCRETERRMVRLGLSIRTIRAIFITHEHTDHTRGAEVLSRKYGIPVHITEATYKHSRMKLEPGMMKTFIPGFPLPVGLLMVTPFSKRHDASDPVSFTVTGNGLTVGVFTDIGIACNAVKQHMSQCHAAFLESNYDEQMLENGRYPVHLKRRIRGEKGHLSNDQALELFIAHRSSFLNLLVLSHLSAENNDPQRVLDIFNPQANGTRIVVASRYEESEVYEIECCRGESGSVG